MQSTLPSNQPAWLQDPSGKWAHRWFDGTQWTDQVSDGDAVHIDPLVPSGSTHPTFPGASTKNETKRLTLIGLLVAVIVVTIIVIGVFFLTRGNEEDAETAAPPVETTAFVEGAELVVSNLDGDGGTTWFVVVDPAATDADLTRIATDLVSTPEAGAIESLEILFFDESGQDLDDFISTTIEVDALSHADDIDNDLFDEVFATLDFEWSSEHYVGVLQKRVLRSSGEQFLGLCLTDLFSFCNEETAIPIEAAN